MSEKFGENIKAEIEEPNNFMQKLAKKGGKFIGPAVVLGSVSGAFGNEIDDMFNAEGKIPNKMENSIAPLSLSTEEQEAVGPAKLENYEILMSGKGIKQEYLDEISKKFEKELAVITKENTDFSIKGKEIDKEKLMSELIKKYELMYGIKIVVTRKA
jgi:hypothetical protein